MLQHQPHEKPDQPAADEPDAKDVERVSAGLPLVPAALVAALHAHATTRLSRILPFARGWELVDGPAGVRELLQEERLREGAPRAAHIVAVILKHLTAAGEIDRRMRLCDLHNRIEWILREPQLALAEPIEELQPLLDASAQQRRDIMAGVTRYLLGTDATDAL